MRSRNPARLTLPPLALTMGEAGGVSTEITVKAWRDLRETGPAFFIIADPAIFNSFECPVAEIRSPNETGSVFDKALPILRLEHAVTPKPGVASSANADAVTESIQRAVAFALSGEAAAIVTNPIQKSALIKAGFAFPGHTEFLAHLTKDALLAGGKTRGPVMMLAGPTLKTIPVTIHQSVVSAAASITQALIINTAKVAAEALQHDFAIEKPRLAISGLNPHAGEAGALGSEEREIIAPAITALRSAGINAFGPLPADTMFHSEARSTYDVALCMLHDQALIPAKTLAFHDAINVTLGLPIIRTSPDHGTALDIAGKNQARADSLIAAINLAAQIAANRTNAT